ncbi:hypothetical protein JW848_03780 [Candidatus Bipolaricaulota bacterium]|nr:hypothetical protein [Candidatus Bipolaricaulota bacterium]
MKARGIAEATAVAAEALLLSSISGTGFADRIAAVEKTQSIQHAEGWRDLRYGEVIAVWRRGTRHYMEFHNTMGSDELPQELREKLDAEAMAEECGAETVRLNGPRYWAINRLEHLGETVAPELVGFGGIQIDLRAVGESSVFNAPIGDEPYKAKVVNRDTAFHFHAAQMLYELTTGNAEVFRTHSQTVDPELMIEDLEHLGDRLQLPREWTYTARTLVQDSPQVASGETRILNDELGHTYQIIR